MSALSALSARDNSGRRTVVGLLDDRACPTRCDPGIRSPRFRPERARDAATTGSGVRRFLMAPIFARRSIVYKSSDHRPNQADRADDGGMTCTRQRLQLYNFTVLYNSSGRFCTTRFETGRQSVQVARRSRGAFAVEGGFCRNHRHVLRDDQCGDASPLRDRE